MEKHLAARAEHIAAAEPGGQAARRLSDLTDEAVRDLARAASSRISGRWAVVALGGWGYGGLLPDSDLDLLVLSEEKAERLRAFVEELLYPLWDAGLKVGHQVRSSKQQIRAMREDVKTLTAALTARPLAGDLAWASEARERWLTDARRRRTRVLDSLSQRERAGSPYLLEPNLKDGAGGRRDFDEIVWTAVLLGAEPNGAVGSLVSSGLLEPGQGDELASDAECVLRARWELQRDGFGDQMSLDAASGLTSVDAERVQLALGRTALTLHRTRSASRGDSTELAPLAADDLFALLEQGTQALDQLQIVAQSGGLDTLIPGMRDLLACRRPGLGHALTVGAHSLRSACLTAELPKDDPMLLSSYEALGDSRLVRIAALIHDAGKQIPGPGHAQRGEQPARASARRCGLAPHECDQVAALVRHHLLFVETALDHDLDDEDTILRCAATLGARELVAPLHVLTAADALATGSGTWTPWAATLVGTLVSRVDTALAPESDGAGVFSRGERVRMEALARLAAGPGAEVTFVKRAPLRYLASRTPEEVARHAELIGSYAAAASRENALLAVSPGPADATHVLTFVATESTELLSRLSGAIALAGLDILGVDAYSVASGTALHVFVVTSATGRAAGTETFARLERLSQAALHDRLDLAVRLRERRRHYPTRSAVRPKIGTTARGLATELKISAPDRVGLLHDVAAAVAANNLDVVWAKARTIDGVAQDVFHIVGADGSSVSDPGVLGHLVMMLRESLG